MEEPGWIPIERLIFGNENWASDRAINEIAVYCDLLENLQGRIDALETRGKDEEVTLLNVQAVISSYAFEIAVKSLWALDNSPKRVPRKHDLAKLYEKLAPDTREALDVIGCSHEILEEIQGVMLDVSQGRFFKEALEEIPRPFVNNRYSMENPHSLRCKVVYRAPLLRSLISILHNKIKAVKEEYGIDWSEQSEEESGV